MISSPEVLLYLLLAAAAAVLGACIGSFCNNWAYRACRKQSVILGRSRCPACKHVLAGRDLIPLVSCLLLKGRCRYCGRGISIRYPLTEAASAVFYLAAFVLFFPANDLELVRWSVLAGLTLTLGLVDLESWELPNGLILAGVLWFFILVPFSGLSSLWMGLAGSAVIAVPLLLLVLLMDKLLGKETMGGGDIKLVAMLGLHLGAGRTLLTLIIACIIGILMALLWKPIVPPVPGEEGASQPRPGRIPFGPALILAAWICALWGKPLLDLCYSAFV